MPGLIYSTPQPFELRLLPSEPYTPYTGSRRGEREINRGTLLNIAPDREELLLSRKTVEELRQFLKIRVGPTTGRWLYRIRKRANPALYEANTRMSTVLPPNDGTNDATRIAEHHLRRVLSASAIPPFLQINASMEKRLHDLPAASDFDIIFDIRGYPIVVSNEKLISPRPLGPTHILVIHTDPGRLVNAAVTITSRRHTQSRPPKAKKPLPPLPYSNVLELPINDLLFVLNVPNIPAPSRGAPTLPPRLHKELPRVLLGPVPHLETFPELVVYLHTHNQAELFRRLVPEWIRDALHPLRSDDPCPTRDTSSNNSFSFSWEATASPRSSSARVLPRVFGILRPTSPSPSLDSLLGSSSSTASSRSSVESSGSSSDPTLVGVMQDLVSLSQDHSSTTSTSPGSDEDERYYYDVDSEAADDPRRGGVDPLMHTIVRLNALRDNLEYIGYFSPVLWHEVEFHRKYLVKAISWRARLSGGAEHVGEED